MITCATCRHWLERADYPGQGGCRKTSGFTEDYLPRKLPADVVIQVQGYKRELWLETTATFGCVLGETK